MRSKNIPVILLLTNTIHCNPFLNKFTLNCNYRLCANEDFIKNTFFSLHSPFLADRTIICHQYRNVRTIVSA